MKRTMAVTVLCVAMMLTGAPVRADDAQSRCARIGQKWVDFWNGLDATKAFDVFTKDIVYEDVTLGIVASGAKAFQAFAQANFDAFPNARFALGQSACHGHQGFIEWTLTGEDGSMDPPASGLCGTGKSYTVRGVAVIEIRGHRISRNTDFWDFTTLLRQLLPEGQECVARLLGVSEE